MDNYDDNGYGEALGNMVDQESALRPTKPSINKNRDTKQPVNINISFNDEAGKTLNKN